MCSLDNLVPIIISIASLIVAFLSLRVSKQSINVSLYPYRKDIIEKLRGDQYDDIFFDIPTLFGERIADHFMTVASHYDNYQKHLDIIRAYQSRLKIDRPETYSKYDAKFQYIPSRTIDKENLTEVFTACKDYKPEIANDVSDEPSNYEELIDKMLQAQNTFYICKREVLSKMQNKLRQGVSTERPFTKKWSHTYIGYILYRTFVKNSNTAYWYVTKDSAHKKRY